LLDFPDNPGSLFWLVFQMQYCAWIYRPSFHENKPKTLVFT
jgi:hypothetical protein